MDGLDYAIETGEYSRKISCHETQLKMCDDNKVKGYTLVLQKCLEELQAKLKNQEAWAGIDNKRNVVCLLVLICNLHYNKSDCKRSIVALLSRGTLASICARRWGG